MTSKRFIAATALMVAATGTCFADTVIQAEVPTTVELSNTDINRIVCTGTMNDLIFSQEKGMTGHFSGNNGFIKFKIQDMGDEYIYADTPSELFVVCNNTVYTLIVTPTDIPSATLRLAPPTGDSFKKNITQYKKLPLEKRALQLVREAYTNTYPISYRVSNVKKSISLAPEFNVTLQQVVDVDGVGLRLKKYQVSSIAKEEINLDERTFLSATISPSILAVAVEKHSLVPDQSTRAYVVEQKEQNQ